MTKFTVTITEPDHLAGITAAREAHNSTANEALEDDQAYVQFVMSSAAASYAAQYTDPLVLKDRVIAEKDRRISELEAAAAAKA